MEIMISGVVTDPDFWFPRALPEGILYQISRSPELGPLVLDRRREDGKRQPRHLYNLVVATYLSDGVYHSTTSPSFGTCFPKLKTIMSQTADDDMVSEPWELGSSLVARISWYLYGYHGYQIIVTMESCGYLTYNISQISIILRSNNISDTNRCLVNRETDKTPLIVKSIDPCIVKHHYCK